MSDLELKKNLCEKLKSFKSFKHCIVPERLDDFGPCSIFARVTYEKIIVTVLQNNPRFYVIAYEDMEKSKNWTDTVYNLFDIPENIFSVLKTL